MSSTAPGTTQNDVVLETLIIAEEKHDIAPIRARLEERGHHVTWYTSAEEVANHPRQRDQMVVVLFDPNKDTLDFFREWRAQQAENVVMCVAVISPDRVDLMPRLVEAGVDEAILESLSDRRRLDARLAFVEEAARTKAERWNAERRAIRREMQHGVITRLAQAAVEPSTRSVLFEKTGATIVDLVEMDASLLLSVSGGLRELKIEAFHGWHEQPELSTLGEQLVRCLDEQCPIRLDVDGLNGQEQPAAVPEGEGFKSGVCVPILSDDEPLGILAAYSRREDIPMPDDVEFLQTIANFLASALRRREAEEALRESEIRAKTILDTTVDAIITIDASGIIESYNQAAEKIFGYTAEEAIGRKINILMPSPYRDEHDEYLENYHHTGERKIIGIGREVVGKRKDGSTFPMYLAVSEMDVAGERLYTGIVRDLTDQRRLEREILRVTEHERHRIGQDLHDGLGQMLTGIGLMCQSHAAQLRNEDHPAAADAEEITQLIKDADQHARMLSRSLVPVEFDERGLVHALERLSRQAERLFGIACEAEMRGTPEFEDITTEVNLYRIAQEAVSNAVKHGQASRVRIMLAAGRERVRLRVQDDGKGFAENWEEKEGLGVRIMHYRARLIGGTLDVQSNGHGATITCTVPYLAPA